MTLQIPIPITANATTVAPTQVIPSPGPNNQLIIYKGNISNRGAAVIRASLQAGINAPRVVVTLAANGGTVSLDFGGSGWPLAFNAPLNVVLSAAGNVDVNITEYVIS